MSALKFKLEELRLKKSHLDETQFFFPVGMFEWMAFTKTFYWSDEMFRIFGMEPNRGKVTLKGMLQFFHPEDVLVFQGKFEDLMRQEGKSIFTNRLLLSDQEQRILQWRVVSSKEGDKVVRITGSVQDISDQVEHLAKIIKP